jgi:serine/threonine protein kinase
MDNSKIIKYLGEGTFAKTYIYEDKKCLYAIKVFRPKETNKKNLKYIEYEVELLKKFTKSDYIINMLKYNIELYKSTIIFELLGCSLFKLIKRYDKSKKFIPLNIIKHISKQILYGLIELKNNGVLHADLKPENILIKDINDTLPSIKLIDLGNAILEKDFITTNQSIQTRHYRPPECIIRAPFDYSADMWAFGCTVFELLTNNILFEPKKYGHMKINSCHLGMFIKIFGNFSNTDIQDGKYSCKYFDLSYDNPVHKFRYMIGKPEPLYKIFKRFGYSKNKSKLLEDFLMPIFQYNPRKRITPEICITHQFLL